VRGSILSGVLESISVLYPNADKLVKNGKNILVKSTAGTALFKNQTPDTQLHIR
jgi:hypothetical protein